MAKPEFEGLLLDSGADWQIERNGERVVATDAERAGAWRKIRAHIAEVNAFYGIHDTQ
jgi:hypothetical protein